MHMKCPFCGEKLICQNNLVNMKYRWITARNYTYSCSKCSRLYMSVNDFKQNFPCYVICILISLMISFIVAAYIKNSFLVFLFFIMCVSIFKQIMFIIVSWFPHNILEIDGNGVPIEEKEKYIVKINDYNKKIKNIKINKPYKILTESEAGIIKLIDLNVNSDEIIFTIGKYSISPIIEKGTSLSFMQTNSNKIICYGEVMNDK